MGVKSGEGASDDPGATQEGKSVTIGISFFGEDPLKTTALTRKLGGYTSATVFSVAALDDARRVGLGSPWTIKPEVQKGFEFLEKYYLQTGASAYQGSVCDGRYWDTILIQRALAESKWTTRDLYSSADYLEKIQQPEGGIPFGLDFEKAPDVDDTAEYIIALAHTDPGRYSKTLKQAADWILQMQSHDGGWGAFDRNNNGNTLLELFVKKFEDSADLFDNSSADVTGHVLEALAALGMRASESKAMKNAVEYLKAAQDPKRFTWSGRWGVNALYGTSAALIGLIEAGESPQASYIQRSLSWMESVQNADGGFGETTASYDDPARTGKGLSTPSQTAWVLQGLLEAGRGSSPVAQRAIRYLVGEFHRQGQWIDTSVVGTGHPSIVYLNYPSYPYAFPLMALGKYLGSLQSGVGPKAPGETGHW